MNNQDFELNGVYDKDESLFVEGDIDEELESFMDADEDLNKDEELVSGDEGEIARIMIEECQGVDKQGHPCSALSLMLESLNVKNRKPQTIAQQSMFKPILTVRRKLDFIELILDFGAPNEPNMKVMISHLEKYDKMIDEMDMDGDTVPQLYITVAPISGLGCQYITFTNPAMWSLCSKSTDELPSLIKLIIRCQDVGFFITDEINLKELESETYREIQNEGEIIQDMMLKEEEERQRREQLNSFFEGTFNNKDAEDEYEGE